MMLLYIDPQDRYWLLDHLMPDATTPRFVVAKSGSATLRLHDTTVWIVEGDIKQRLSEVDYGMVIDSVGGGVVRGGCGCGGGVVERVV